MATYRTTEPNKFYAAPSGNFHSDRYGEVSGVTDSRDITFFEALGADAVNDDGALQQDLTVLRSSLKARAALGKVLAGTGRMRVAILGDSTVANSIDVRANGWPRMLATALTNLGVNAIEKDFFGGALLSAQTLAGYTTYNTQVAMDAGWGFSSNRSLGGQLFTNSTTTGKIAWTIPGTTDKIECYHIGGNTGAFNYDVDGGAATNITTTTSQTFTKTVLSPASGANHLLNVTRVSGIANFVGALAYDSAVPAVDVLNLGCGSALSSSIAATTSVWSVSNAITTLAPDLTIIVIGINDDLQAVTSSTVRTNLQTVVTAGLTTGDVWVVRPTPIAVSIFDYTSAYQSVAAANNCSYIDFKTAMGGSYTAANDAGLMADANHPDVDGNALLSGFLARRILSL